jgi:hypothetical protein
MTPGLPAKRDGVAVAAIARSSGAVAAGPGDPAGDAVRLPKFLRYRVHRQGGHSGAPRRW